MQQKTNQNNAAIRLLLHTTCLHLLLSFAAATHAAMTVTTQQTAVEATTAAPTQPQENMQELSSTTATTITISESTTTTTRTTKILTPSELDLYTRSLDAIKDGRCRQDLNATLQGILAGQRWAIAMYDATAKSAYGIEMGLLHQFGHYDECLSQNRPTSVAEPRDEAIAAVRAKYCLATVRLNDLAVQNVDSRQVRPTAAETTATDEQQQQQATELLVQWGVCVPASCSGHDVVTYLQHLLQRDVLPLSAMAEADDCQLQAQQVTISGGMFAYAFVICFFVFLALLSTTYHAYLLIMARRQQCALAAANSSGSNGTASPKKPSPQKLHRPSNEVLHMALLSFSIIENTKKLFQVSKDQLGLNAINGIKALAMIFILAGHALSFIYGGPVYNAEFISEHIKLPIFAFLSNSLLFVDVFLLLSGFLFCRILLIELQRRRGQVNALILYVGRYIRLTPAYMAIIGFYMTWFPFAGNGPLWRQRIEREQERCLHSWWANILYINNYVSTDQLCMFQSWYLSVDTQLFIIAPMFIFLLYRLRKWGVSLLSVAAVLTAALPFAVTFWGQLDPTLMVFADEINDLASNAFYIGSYIKTHMRASAYVIGLLCGFIVHVMHEKSIRLPSLCVRAGWCAAVLVGIASMFSISRFYAGSFSVLESTLYAGFHKLGWNLSVAWLVIAVTTGHAGWIQRFLSSHCFAPISRLTYCAYLSNGIVELYHAASQRSYAYMSYISLINEVLVHIFDTFLLAFVLCLLFESPIHALERILLRSQRSGRAAEERNRAKQAAGDNHTPSTSEERV